MDILLQFEKIRNPFFTKIAENFTFFGEHLVVIAVICALYWCYDKQIAYRITFGLFISSMIVQGLKITFRIPRPWIRSIQLHPVESVIDTATGYSFPSGHTQAGTALYGMLAMLTKKVALRIICICLIFGVAFSRMYLGVHTLQDVATSIILTTIIILIVYQVSKVKFTNRLRILVASLIGLVSAGLLAYSLTLYYNDVIELTYATDSCNAAFAGLGLALGWYLESCLIQFSVKTQGISLQILKYIIGMAITVSIKLALGEILGPTILGEGILNFTLILWIMVFYPLIIKKVFSVKSKASHIMK
jgi:undecaprenyl-diphosphatase